MDRVLTIPSRETDIAVMAMMLPVVPWYFDIRHADAIALAPGLGEYWRISTAIQIWEKQANRARFFLIAGVNPAEQTNLLLTPEVLASVYGLRKQIGVHISRYAEHTRAQADWFVAKVCELNIQSIALVTSPYHLLRQYATLIRAFLRHRISWIPIVPVSAVVSLDTIVPETGASAWDLAPGEIARMIAYQDKGDVAILGEMKAYLHWLSGYART